MKFILNENTAKFVLNERFILNEDTLTEATSSEVINSFVDILTADTFDKLKKIINTTANNTKLSKRLDQYIDKLNTAKNDVEDVSRLALNATTLESIKTNINKYLAAAQKVYNELVGYVGARGKDTLKPIGTKLKQLATLTSTAAWDKQNSEKALKIYNNVSEIFDKAVSDNFTNTTTAKDIEEFKELCNTVAEQIDKNKVNTPKNIIEIVAKNNLLSDDQLKDTANAISALNKEVEPIISNSTIKGDIAKQKATLNELSAKLAALSETAGAEELAKFIKADADKKAAEKAEEDAKKAAEEAEKEAKTAAEKKEKEEHDKLYNSTDWAKLYANCNTPEDFDSFWEEYYKTEWGIKAEAVKDFGITFTQDLQKFGWDAISNPIVGFLKLNGKDNVLKDADNAGIKGINIFDLIGTTFTGLTYNILHNALARSELELRDFTANRASSFGLSNIIFNTNLYKQAPQDIIKYLKAQASVRINAHNLEDDDAKFYAANQDGRRTVLSNIMLENGKTSNLRDPAVKNTVNGILRPITVITRILAAKMGASAENSRDVATDNDIIECLNKITSADMAKKILAYLIEVWSTTEFANKLRTFESSLNTTLNDIHDNNRPSLAAITAFKDILPFKNKKISSQQATLLLDGLAKKADLLKAK